MGYGQLLGIQRRLIELAAARSARARVWRGGPRRLGGHHGLGGVPDLARLHDARQGARSRPSSTRGRSGRPFASPPQFLTRRCSGPSTAPSRSSSPRYVSLETVGIYAIAQSLVAVQNIAHRDRRCSRPASPPERRWETGAMGTMLKRVTGWNITMSLPWFALLMVVPGRCWGCSARLRGGGEALAILAVAQLVNTAFGPLGMVMNMTHRQYINLSNNLAAGPQHRSLLLPDSALRHGRRGELLPRSRSRWSTC